MPPTFSSYVQMLYDQDFDGSLVFMPDYMWIAVRSLYLALMTTVLSLAIGFPVAWYIVCQSATRRKVLLTLVSLPFWINTLIRTYCWILILRDEGLINGFLKWLGIAQHPLPLLYNQGAILLGLVYTFLPFMVLPIYATLERVDPRLIEAAYDLYANRWQLFRRVIWPLTKPGIAAGTVLVFAPALGAFLQPDLLGGGKQLLIGSLIEMQFTSSRNWPFGAALSMLVTFAVLVALAWQSRRSKAAGEARA
jgi:spermidine/putrescine transport system permease protein